MLSSREDMYSTMLVLADVVLVIKLVVTGIDGGKVEITGLYTLGANPGSCQELYL